MVIEIKGGGSHNKGAEMMLLTVLDQLKGQAGVKFTVTPQLHGCEYSFYSRLGLHPKIDISYRRFSLGDLGRVIPAWQRSRYGLILDREVDAVLDISGFAYSSSWGDRPTSLMARKTTRWKKQQTRILLLPQAFGPFATHEIRQDMQRIIENSDPIYARDKVSELALRRLVDTDKIKLSSDFTSLFKGRTPPYFDEKRHDICIVPNKRMVDKGQDPEK